MQGLRFTVAILLPMMASVVSYAGAPAEQSPQDLLIDKLNHVNMTLPGTDPAKVPVTLRLADLYAERARLAAMADLDNGCTVCEAGKADRQKALRLYTDVLPKANSEQKSKIQIQMGHLNQLLGNEKAAIASYEAVLNENSPSTLKAEANLALAEVFYKKNKYSEARSYYQKVLDEKTASSRGLSAYRMAWCNFNTGKFTEAVHGIKTILKTPELQSRSAGAATTQADQGFLEEVSRDLATFMARESLSMDELTEIYNLSPSTTRLANVVLLANEFERTGKKPEATQVWNYAFERMSVPSLKLEALVHLTPLKFKESDTTASLKTMEEAVAMWTEMKGCGTKDCTELQKILRQFVVNWNQTEKKAPSENLQRAYQAFVKLFPADHQVQLWGAQVAQTRKDWSAAAEFYKAAVSAMEPMAKPGDLESPLLSFVEMAEMSKDEVMWTQATDLYVAKSKLHTKAHEISYQKAQKIYDKGDYAAASIALREIALNKTFPAKLREQAAHLSLDAIALQKQDDKLVAWSLDYAAQFPANAKDFKAITQKSVLTESAKLAEKDSEAAWTSLMKFNPQEASSSDKKIFLKNKIVLAEKTKRFTQASQAVDEYLLLSDLSAEEKEFALGKKTYLAELRLDFSTALKSFEKMSAPQLKPDQKFLKLAQYADLAGANSQAYYQGILSSTKDADLKTEIAAQLIRKSSTPDKELAKNINVLQGKPELLGLLYSEIYVKNPTPANLKAALSNKTIEPTTWGRSLWRVSYMEQLKPLQAKLAAANLDSKNQKTLTKTIKSRATDLEALEKLTATAIQKGDWTAQVASVSVVAKENQRFYEELMSLPVPQGLSPQEESEYMNLLGQQAAPYKNKADEAKGKVTEFWASNWRAPLQKSVSEAGEFRLLVDQEIKALQAIAEPTHQSFLKQLLETREIASVPDLKSAEAARNEVRESPLDKLRLQKLLGIEKQNKNMAMVQYLEGRIKTLEEKGTPQ